MRNNHYFKEQARKDLGGSIFHNDWLMAFLVCLVAGAILSAPSALSELFDVENESGTITVTVSLISAAAVFLTGPIMLGLTRIFLKKARVGGPIVFGELFQGFRNYWDHMLLGFMPALFAGLWSLIPIVGVFFAIYKGYGWAMVYYIKCDNTTLNWKQCMNRSAEIMQGRRWELFCLQISFIGWYILGALALGVGVYWVEAYRRAAETHFYEQRRRGYGVI